jgi:hypothetical protein
MLKPKEEKRNPETWKKNVSVQKRAAGEEYISATNKFMKNRKMKPPCKRWSRMKCTQTIPEDAQQIIYSQFRSSQLKNNQKRQFIRSGLQEVPVERVRVRTGKRIGKQQTSKTKFENPTVSILNKIKQISNNIYLIPSQSQEKLFYIVNTEVSAQFDNVNACLTEVKV